MLRKCGVLPPIAIVVTATCAVTPSTQIHAQGREWYEKTRCVGMEGMSWVMCQKARKQNRRDRENGVRPGGKQWYEKIRCLGLEGAPWIACQKALKQKKRERDR